MEIKEIHDLINGDKHVFIKPVGRRYYYNGTIGKIPHCMKSLKVLEISPQVYSRDNQLKPFITGLLLLVEGVEELDILEDNYKISQNDPKRDIDYVYNLFMSDKENCMEQLKKTGRIVLE